MRVIDLSPRPVPPAVVVEDAPAYELLLSLRACRDTNPSPNLPITDWTARLRDLAPPDLLDEMAAFDTGYTRLWIRLLGLAYTSPAPKDVAALRAHLAALDPPELARMLWADAAPDHEPTATAELFHRALAGDPVARVAIGETLAPDDPEARAALAASLARGPEEMQEQLLALLRRWHDAVFSRLESEILPVLARDAAAKRVLHASLSDDRLIELATNGVNYIPEAGVRRVVLIPTLVYRPWVVIARYRDAKLITYPVADAQVAGDADAPPERLVVLYRALGDERRLHILKKLASATYTMQELGDMLGLAKSTIHHHIVTLRAAGLISVSSDAERRYSLRREAPPDAAALLQAYLGRAAP